MISRILSAAQISWQVVSAEPLLPRLPSRVTMETLWQNGRKEARSGIFAAFRPVTSRWTRLAAACAALAASNRGAQPLPAPIIRTLLAATLGNLFPRGPIISTASDGGKEAKVNVPDPFILYRISMISPSAL